MNVNAVGQNAYLQQVSSWERYDKTTLTDGVNQNTGKQPESDKDSVNISQDALNMEKEAVTLKEMSDRAFKMLKRRKISDDDIGSFKELLIKADKTESAKDFLKALSGADRDLVKRANSHGRNLSDSYIDGMSEEGARNMLVQPDPRSYVDFNNDGIVEHGQGKGFVFPPPNAPEKVKDAWDKTIAGLPEKEMLLASTVFLSLQLSANVKCDSQGKAVGIYFPGEKGYTNIFPNDTKGWLELLDKADNYLNWSKSVTSDPKDLENIEKDQKYVSAFRNNINKNEQI